VGQVSAVHRADRLTVVHHDDSTTDYTDVRYQLTRAGLRILDAAGTETDLCTHDVLTTHALTTHARPTSGGSR
jgi:hypothetical protein